MPEIKEANVPVLTKAKLLKMNYNKEQGYHSFTWNHDAEGVKSSLISHKTG